MLKFSYFFNWNLSRGVFKVQSYGGNCLDKTRVQAIIIWNISPWHQLINKQEYLETVKLHFLQVCKCNVMLHETSWVDCTLGSSVWIVRQYRL